MFHNLREGGIVRQLPPPATPPLLPAANPTPSALTPDPHPAPPAHPHPNQHPRVCLEGEWIRIQDGVEHHVKAGDFWQTPPHVPHGGRTLDRRCIVLDIFAPPREEYRQPGQGLGAASASQAGA